MYKTPSVCRFKTSPCVPDHAHMLKHVCAWCWYTRGRIERTHGDVWSGHTGFSACHTPHTPQHKTQHTTTHHNNTTTTPHENRDRDRQRQRERDRERRRRQRREEKREERREKREETREKREKSFSVWWCMAVFSCCSALSCSFRQTRPSPAQKGQVKLFFHFFQCILAGLQFFYYLRINFYAVTVLIFYNF